MDGFVPIPSAYQKTTKKHAVEKSMHKLLVIDSSPYNDWCKVFKGSKGPDGQELIVDQTSWDLIEVFTDNGEATVTIKPSAHPLTRNQGHERTFKPDFMLIRNFVIGIHGQTFVPSLCALIAADVPAVNSLQSIFLSTQRANSIGALNRIRRTLEGTSHPFPMIPMKFYTNTQQTYCFRI